MEHPPLWSIVIPVYGDDWAHFGKLFEALAAQTDCLDMQIIVVFDGPNPKGQTALDEWTRRTGLTDKVESLVIAHAGAPAARNAGAAKANGTYLLFLDADKYLKQNRLQIWAEAFEDSGADMIWGNFDLLMPDGQLVTLGGNTSPRRFDGKFDAYTLRSTNYIDTCFPIRRDKFLPWREELKSLQDWNWWLDHLDAGHTYHYIDKSFFLAEPPEEGGLSDDSSKHWLERWSTVRQLHHLPTEPDMVVGSHGAPHHALHVAHTLGKDILGVLGFKPHRYQSTYLLGFYTHSTDPRLNLTDIHFSSFNNGPKGMKKIVHWIGTDIFHLQWGHPAKEVIDLVKRFKKEGIIHLCEAEFTQKELKELGIEAQIVPIPPGKLYDVMPLPEEFTVALYENPGNRMYHEALTAEIISVLPDIQFLAFGDPNKADVVEKNVRHFGYATNMEDVLKQSSCILRLSVHDGLPLTPLEFMSAGRPVITNVPLKGAVQIAATREAAVKAIRQLKKDCRFDPNVRDYWLKELDHDKYRQTMAKIVKGHRA